MKQNYRKLGEIVKLVDERNKSLVSTEVLGISIDKEFMPSVANTIGTDLSNYKLLKKNRFACNPMHVGRDERLPVSLYNKEIPAIVSPAYFMFEIFDSKIVLPEYLMLNFKRADFDRNCWFRTDGSVRGGIAWDDLCELELPVPDLTEQQRIVNAYNTVDRRIRLLKQINEKLEATAQCLFDELNKDKSNFENKTIQEISKNVICGKTPSTAEKSYWGDEIPFITIPDMHGNNFIHTTERYLSNKGKESQNAQTLPAKAICISCIATVGLVSMTTKTSQTNQQINSIICDDGISPYFIFLSLKNMKEELKRLGAGGSTTLNVSKSLFSQIKISIPTISDMNNFEKNVSPLFEKILNNEKEIEKLLSFKQLIISRISSI